MNVSGTGFFLVDEEPLCGAKALPLLTSTRTGRAPDSCECQLRHGTAALAQRNVHPLNPAGWRLRIKNI
jgi:hypothetical protein